MAFIGLLAFGVQDWSVVVGAWIRGWLADDEADFFFILLSEWKEGIVSERGGEETRCRREEITARKISTRGRRCRREEKEDKNIGLGRKEKKARVLHKSEKETG